MGFLANKYMNKNLFLGQLLCGIGLILISLSINPAIVVSIILTIAILVGILFLTGIITITRVDTIEPTEEELEEAQKMLENEKIQQQFDNTEFDDYEDAFKFDIGSVALALGFFINLLVNLNGWLSQLFQ